MNPYEKEFGVQQKQKRIPLHVPLNLAPSTLSGWLKYKMADALEEFTLINSNINVLPFR